MEIEPHAAIALTSTAAKGVQGGVRHSVLQGIWWWLDSWMFLGTESIISILAFLEKH